MDQHLIQKYLNGEASFEERFQVLNWVEASEEHRRELLAYRQISNILLFNESRKSPVRKRRTFRSAMFAGICCAAVAAIVLFVVGVGRNANSGAASIEQIYALVGQQTETVLSDGTRVFLNSGSRLDVLSFNKRQRRVRLEGEAYFDVAKDPRRQFVVETDSMSVSVLGTAFSVRNYGADQKVVLVRGSVELSSVTSDGDMHKYRLIPNQMFVRDPDTGSGSLSYVNAEDYLCWVNGYLQFDNVPLKSVLSELQTYYGVSIDDSVIGEKEFLVSGKLDIRRGISSALDNLTFLAPIKVSAVEEDNYRIER